MIDDLARVAEDVTEPVIAFAARAPFLKPRTNDRGEREMTAIDLKAQPDVATRLLAGVSVPDTPLISRAIDFARERSEPYLFNHVMRSWLFCSDLRATQTACA